MNIQVLVDNKNSWIVPFAQELRAQLVELRHTCEVIHNHNDITEGHCLFLLGCEKILEESKKKLHKYNVVVHESKLPQGRGWSPTTWQVLEGAKEIAVTLFEAAEKIDNGNIYLQKTFALDGTELIDEIRNKQGQSTIKLFIEFVKGMDSISSKAQNGEPTYYKRRTAADSELDINKTISEQFNLLRVCDNERYPAFFNINDQKYILKIYKAD
jgi:methionyl-tRNA formyltransferase